MTVIAFIGAGSVVFTRDLLADILRFPELAGSTIRLHDIDPERLQTARTRSGTTAAGSARSPRPAGRWPRTPECRWRCTWTMRTTTR